MNVTLSTLNKLKSEGKKFSCLTAYDSTFAHVISSAGVEVLLVGDSLGMVLQGKESTVPVTIEEMVYHTECVRRGNQGSLIMVDMPFMGGATDEKAYDNAARLMQAGAHVVKVEGGAWFTDSVSKLSDRGIPVCVHLGLTPQSINKFGGYKVQGRDEEARNTLLQDSIDAEKAGASVLLFECIPNDVTAEIMANVSIPVIGIGAGPSPDAQVLVLHDMLGLTPRKMARFVHNFMQDGDGSIQGAISAYDQAVKNGDYPKPEHCFE